MENGRCETTFSMLSPDKKIGFKLFSPYFQEMITWGRNNRGNNRGNHKSHKGATKTILLTPITVEKKLFLLFPCCLCCLLWGYWIPCCWLWEDGARRPPSYFSSPSRKGSLCPILQQQARRTLAKNGVNIGRSQAKCGAKPCNKSGESLEKVGRKPWESHAASTVMNMENGRCSCSYRPSWTRATVGVRRLSQGFRRKNAIFSAY